MFSFFVCCLSLCFFFFFFNDTATTEIYTLSLHDALPICRRRDRLHGHRQGSSRHGQSGGDRKSTRLNSSHQIISYAVFCLKKKKQKNPVATLGIDKKFPFIQWIPMQLKITVSKSEYAEALVHFRFFFFNDTATTEIYTLSLHDALPISDEMRRGKARVGKQIVDRRHFRR